jgi:hypothetical protein
MEGPSTQYPPTTSYQPATSYPLTYSVDYPDRPLNRATTFFRLLWLIPIWVIVGLVGRGGILSLPALLMLLFRKKYPRWWFDWNLELSRFSARVSTYAQLLRDEYPSTDEQQAVHLDAVYPDAKQLSRGLPLVKWFLAIPHYFVLYFLQIFASICVMIAWFAILFTGRYPRALFDFVVGVKRWSLRVSAYTSLLITDQYPPFSLH